MIREEELAGLHPDTIREILTMQLKLHALQAASQGLLETLGSHTIIFATCRKNCGRVATQVEEDRFELFFCDECLPREGRFRDLAMASSVRAVQACLGVK